MPPSPLDPLPIDPLLPEIVASLAQTPTLVLEAPPGAGKTTRVPRALLDAGIDGEIVVLEPRRLAARMAARRVAEELGERVGGTVGYQVRFEDVSSAKTRIRFVTEGVLTRKLLGARSAGTRLDGIGAVLLDEFHERHLQGDIALALVQMLRADRRPDLRVVAMSATLATAPIADFLQAPTLRAEGRRFDVTLDYLPASDDRPLASQVASAVRRLVIEGLDGDVLVFLPGAAEIRRAQETCEKLASEHDLDLVPLHGDLSAAEQDRAVRRGPRRKIVLSTNVAESSVTIEGVVAVVDSGLARVAQHASWSGLPTLRVERVSRASAIQRAGRAGRVRAGRCLRLYTKADFETRPEHEVPEVHRIDLTQTVLELRAAGVAELSWLDAPRADAVRAAETLLGRLGALDPAGHATPLGRDMARFAVHPRQARVLVEAERRGVASDGCVMAALLAERDIRQAARTRFGDARGHDRATERSDLSAMLDAFLEAAESRFSAGALRAIGLDPGATAAVERARAQLWRAIRKDAPPPADPEVALLQSVLAGYPDRVARRVRARNLALAGGGTAELSEASAVRDAQWMVAVDAEERRAGGNPGGVGGARGGVVVRAASAIEPEWLIDLYPEWIHENTDARWNASARRVDAVDRLEYDGLALDESPSTRTDSATVTRVLAEAALEAGPRAFAAEGALDRWLARVRFAASVRPDQVPALSDENVREALVALCEGRRSFAELEAAGLLDALRERIGHAASNAVERLAPERVTLLGGRSARIEYDEGKPPWTESYLQDFFGMAETPRAGDSRVPLVLHLLAPNRRSVQTTTDLAGFWVRHYPALRKELMRRYPRHSWPEDPTVPAPRLRRGPLGG